MARITKPLTNTEVDKAKPKEKDYSLMDGEGLFLRIKPNGTKQWLFNYYRPITNKRTNLGIGRYPEISLAQARQMRAEYRALLAQGIDPQAKRKESELQQEKQIQTFYNVAQEWREKRKNEVEALTMEKNWGRMEKHLFPFIGSLPVEDIAPLLLVETLKPLEKADKNDTLHRLINLTRQILRFAVNRGILEFNKCENVSAAFYKKPVEHHPAIKSHEVPQLFADIEQSDTEPQTRYLMKWQLLTMVRAKEAAGVKWDEIDFENAVWYIPAERMKKAGKSRHPHKVPLAHQALALLECLRPITGREIHVFPHRIKKGASMSSQTVAKALERMGYKDRLDSHGMRTVARTFLAENNVIHEHAEKCLAHAEGNEVSRAYNRTDYFEQRKPIMQLWADFLEQCAAEKGLAFP